MNECQWLRPIRLTYPGGLTLEDERARLLRMDLRTLKNQAGNPIASLDYGYNARTTSPSSTATMLRL